MNNGTFSSTHFRFQYITFPKFSALQIWRAGLQKVEKTDFEKLCPIKFLDLKENEITSIHTEAFSKLLLLRRLNVRKNKLKCLGMIFINNKLLISVDFRFNKIFKINPNIFEFSEILFEVEFDGNICINAGFSKNYADGPKAFSKLESKIRTCYTNYETSQSVEKSAIGSDIETDKDNDDSCMTEPCIINSRTQFKEAKFYNETATNPHGAIMPDSSGKLKIFAGESIIVSCKNNRNNFNRSKGLSQLIMIPFRKFNCICIFRQK